ncbi:MAG: replication restart helicase PriA [bacterium]|jgi:primosomal protein N' (replication factor Y)
MTETKTYVEIAFPIPSQMLFTYEVPANLKEKVQSGCRVYAPLGRRQALGYVISIQADPPAEIENIKQIHSLVDEEPLFSSELMNFLHWTSQYYLSSPGETFSAAYPFSPSVKPRMVKVVLLNHEVQTSGQIPETVRRESQRQVLELLINRKALLTPSDIVRELGVSQSTLKTLQKNGLIQLQPKQSLRIPVYSMSEVTAKELTLTDEQIEVLVQISRELKEVNPKPILLHGVTGSGKTEVYLQAIQTALDMGKNALVLIPEISLTPQTMDRFRTRFGDRVGILHSALGQGERFDEWRMIKEGERRIVVGTRSAIFAPVVNLGIIIVDEEHESSYKQHDPSPRYHARDLAAARASLCGALCILGSATPSIESMYNARSGKYNLLTLSKRVALHGLPQVTILDMRGRTDEEEILCHELQEALWNRYEQQQQSILFLNRRGFATTLTCRHCGQTLSCEHCSVALVYHRSSHVLKCHHCDYQRTLPNHCPVCHDPFIQQRGFGTERVVEEVQKIIPYARIIRLDKDTTRRKGEHDRLLTPFRRGEADILVGTQMIAKGLDFPNVTLVGIINADYALALPDFRAAERTFTLLTQVAGRAGRGQYAGEVFVQTYCPDHYSVQLAISQNYNTFYEKEIRYRQLIGFPPFSRLVLWRVEGNTEELARGKAWELYHILYNGLKHVPEVTILPPVEAPLYRLRDYYRWQVALKSRTYKAFRPLLQSEELQQFLQQRRKGIRIIQDVDPWDML